MQSAGPHFGAKAEKPGRYRELLDLDCEVLIPELYQIVIDYAVEIFDYQELKRSFGKVSYRELFTKFGARPPSAVEGSIGRWQAAILRQNREFWTQATYETCDHCSIRLYSTIGDYWCTKFHFIVGGSWEPDAHHYHMCIICSIQINPTQDEIFYNRRCRSHAVKDTFKNNAMPISVLGDHIPGDALNVDLSENV
jgi:hypothetical protein